MKRVAAILLVIALLLAGCGKTKLTWQEQYDLGLRYLSEGNYEEAILAFNAAIEIDPKRPEAYVQLAEVYIATGEEDKAREVLENAIALIGEDEEVQKLLNSIAGKEISVEFEVCYNGIMEYAEITATDEEGSVVWTKTTEGQETAQCLSVGEIGIWQDRYYYIDYPAIVAADLQTGEELWRNEEYVGSASGDALIDDDGSVYVTGYLGPDFFAVDKDGETLERIDSLDGEYYWAYDLEMQGNSIEVTLSNGPYGYRENGGYTFTVDLTDFSYSYPKDVFDEMGNTQRAKEIAEMVITYCNANWDRRYGEYYVFDNEVYENGDGSTYWVVVRFQEIDTDPDDDWFPQANVYCADLLIDAQDGAVTYKNDEEQRIEGYLW